MLRPQHYFLQAAIAAYLLLFPCSQNAAFSSHKAHPIHTTNTEITYSVKSQAFEITIKAFTDDFENAIRKDGAPALYLGDEKELANANEYIAKYLATHLAIAINGKPQPIRLLGKEAKADVTWCYLTLPWSKSVQRMTFTNRLHTDLYTDQNNILHCTLYGKRQSQLFSSDNITASMDWK